MVPRLTKTGQSFKGAALYYLHDKRAAGENVRLTADRVAWTETRNLPTADPDRAWRMMADTASQQARLKEAAGIKTTGRKLENPVLAYSLSWHADDKVDREHMLRAADASLKALKLEQHQALIVAHKDTAHPHVHILVNRVSPIDGRAASLSMSKEAFSRWAQAYEQEQGVVRCNEREKNIAARDAARDFNRQAGAKDRCIRVPKARNDSRADWRERRQSADAARRSSRSAELLRQKQLEKDRELSQRSSEIHARHRQQWKDLQDRYRRQKTRIAVQREAAVKAAVEEAKAARKGNWRAYYKGIRAEERAFWRNERSALGKAWNTLRLATSTPVGRQGFEHRGGMARMFNLLVSQKSRHAALQASFQEEKALRFEAQKLAIKHVAKQTRDSFKAEYQKSWKTFQQERAEIVAQQDFDRKAIRGAWRERRTDRAQAWQAFRDGEGRFTERLSAAFGLAAGQGRADHGTSKDGLSHKFDTASGHSRQRAEDTRPKRSPDHTSGNERPTGQRPGR